MQLSCALICFCWFDRISVENIKQRDAPVVWRRC